MKKLTAFLIAIVLCVSFMSLSAGAKANLMKADGEVINEKLASLDPERELAIDAWFDYPDQPDFHFDTWARERFGDGWDDFDSLNLNNKEIKDRIDEAREEFRQERRTYFNQKNQESADKISDVADVKVNFLSPIEPHLTFTAKAKDIEAIAELPFIRCLIDLDASNEDIYTEKPAGEKNLFEEKFDSFISRYQVAGRTPDYSYEELFCHQTDNGETDWVLYKGYPCVSGGFSLVMEINGRIVCGDGMWSDFYFPYGVYDVAQDRFINLYELRDSIDLYDGMEDALSQYHIGRLLGDVDQDDIITVLDATKLQKALANLLTLEDDEINGSLPDFSAFLKYYSDYDRDGSRSVLDATKIQKHLASLA